MVYVVLCCRVGECKAKVHFTDVLAFVVCIDELLKTIRDVLPELVRITGLEFLRHAILRLDDVELGFLISQDDLTDSQVSASHIQSKESSGLVSIREGHAPSWVHWLYGISFNF